MFTNGENHKMPPSRRDWGLLFLPDLESNSWSSLQTSQEYWLPLGHSVGSKKYPVRLERRAESFASLDTRPDSPGEFGMQPRVQFSVVGWGCVHSLLFDLRPNYGGGNEDDWVLLLKSCACTAVLRPCGRPPLTQASTRDLWTLTGKSRSVSCGVTAPFSWVLVHTRFYFCPSSFFCPSSVQVLAALWWDKWWPPPRGLMPQAVWDPGLLYPESLPLQ